MVRINALWVDRRLKRLPQSPPAELTSACQMTRVHDGDDLRALVREQRPVCIVFDFDYPDAAGLRALLKTRQQFAYVPVLMLIEPCYDSLLLWALRARVWDVLIKPVPVASLLQRVAWLHAAASATDADGMRINAMPGPPVPVEARFAAAGASSRHRTDSVCNYVKDHLHEKLSEAALARRYGMSRCQFSRAFHGEHGVTFREYVLSARLHRAIDMLGRTEAPITEVAFCAGFRDLSHFASQFRRHAGCSPSQFRQRLPGAVVRQAARPHKNHSSTHKTPSRIEPQRLPWAGPECTEHRPWK